MPDEFIEKVLKGLECCNNISQDGCLMLCPYKDEQDETYSGFCEHVLKRDALQLIEFHQSKIKQLKNKDAVEPEMLKHEDGWIEYYCGNCKAYLLQDNAEVRSIIWHPKYCSVCGQAVKWDD